MNEVTNAGASGLLKRIESLIKLAFARARQGAAAFLAASNQIQVVNVAAIGPATGVSADASLTTVVSGVVELTVTGTVITQVATQSFSTQLTKDGVPFGPLVTWPTGAGETSGGFSMTSLGIGTLGTHTWGVAVANVTAPADTVEIPATGVTVLVTEQVA
jgi:hypothetical protein